MARIELGDVEIDYTNWRGEPATRADPPPQRRRSNVAAQDRTTRMKKFAGIPPADRFGLNREEASDYVGVGHTLFDAMVADGRMPKPYLINTRRVWARLELEAAFVKLPKDDEGAIQSDPWAASVA